jgi:Rrf2 family protein
VFCMDLPPRIYESLKTLGCLANARGPLQAHEIASATGLPPAQTAKILQSMTWAGFVESRRGARGGFWLVVPASRIRVTDVIEFFSPSSSEHPGAGQRSGGPGTRASQCAVPEGIPTCDSGGHCEAGQIGTVQEDRPTKEFRSVAS